MTSNQRENLQRAAGILDGLAASEDISEAITNMIVTVSEMIDEVLREEMKCVANKS